MSMLRSGWRTAVMSSTTDTLCSRANPTPCARTPTLCTATSASRRDVAAPPRLQAPLMAAALFRCLHEARALPGEILAVGLENVSEELGDGLDAGQVALL